MLALRPGGWVGFRDACDTSWICPAGDDAAADRHAGWRGRRAGAGNNTGGRGRVRPRGQHDHRAGQRARHLRHRPAARRAAQAGRNVRAHRRCPCCAVCSQEHAPTAGCVHQHGPAALAATQSRMCSLQTADPVPQCQAAVGQGSGRGADRVQLAWLAEQHARAGAARAVDVNSCWHVYATHGMPCVIFCCHALQNAWTTGAWSLQKYQHMSTTDTQADGKADNGTAK